MEHLAEMLLTECDSLHDEFGDGSLKHFAQTAGKPMMTDDGHNPFGEWSSGTALRELHSELYDYTNTFYGRLVEQLDAAAQALKAAADRYRNADDTTAAALPKDASATTGGHAAMGTYTPAGTMTPVHGDAHKPPTQVTDFEGPDQ